MIIHKIAAFTDNGQGGNPAGVVIADALPAPSLMQKIAAQVGYSETVFSAPKDDIWHTRYFSPETEIPFCGHATIALGAVLAQQKSGGPYHLALKNGDITLDAHITNGIAYATLQSPPTRNAPVSPAIQQQALALFGYHPDDLDRTLPFARIHAGADHLLIPLQKRETLARMSYNLAQGKIFMQDHGFTTISLIWRETDKLFHTRNAFASGGVLEDPATGAAAAALAGMLRDKDILTEGELTILQGADMGCPSRIHARITAEKGSFIAISGAANMIE